MKTCQTSDPVSQCCRQQMKHWHTVPTGCCLEQQMVVEGPSGADVFCLATGKSS